MIKAVLFDLDGTLIDSESHYINGTIEWLANNGVNISFEQACCIIGKSMDETYDYLSFISGIEKQKIIDYNEDYFTKRNPLNFRKLIFNDVKSCFELLKKKKIKICICSMSPKSYIEHFMNECQLNKYVDLYISGDECLKTKPDPEIYQKTISNLGLDCKEVVIVEDALSGLKSAKDSGAYVVARNSAKFGLKQIDALRILEDLSELSTIIMEINNGKYD